ncbi:hypothetical protein, partial [Salmonella enterica]|uniref:hypothetical protein n=1 Tax=Salmonella enterica TaxID=28901 RepID=UPI003524C905
GIPTWLIAREYRFSTGMHWRSGVLLRDGQEPGHLALVRVFKDEKYLELTVRGPLPFGFFNLLKDGIELLLARFPGLEIKRFIPCANRMNQCTQEFDVKNLEKRFYELKK